ncbi:terminase large subunit domain-containing protein [Acetanaerobacterium elongatum]|uniref:Terminase-like family protein n=1 Tax=Acetanaerobacterium elongatum TaxID=258515 RepID=A0A1H0BML8_9FIRM|nr:terminase family protein [Acetanaerobacterium elongatum]SDN46785.1 Terminase-like family protein [Acetanaerobacterium elongatum]
MTVTEKLKRIMNSPVLYIENFMKVVDKNGKLIPFVLNPQQKELIKGMDKYNIILKSRQLGITTLSCAYSIYLACTNSNTTCLLVSYSIDSATSIFEKLKQLYNDLPKSLSVELIANNKKELKFVNGSRIICATCGSKDVARGLTIRFAHLSEIGFMKDTVDKQLLAIEQALTPNGRIILESTANGLNYFSELWNKAERKESLYKPFFFSWIDDKVMFKDEYEMFCRKYTALHTKLPALEELNEAELALHNQGASIEQIVWRRLKIANSSESSFAQEFPSNPIEAFVSTGCNIFSSKLIHERLNYVDENTPLKNKPINLPNCLIQWFNRGLSLWDAPKQGIKYYIGVDTGEGLGQDYSAFQVITQDGEQVAEFKSNQIKPFQYAELVSAIGIYFNRALLVIEKASAGHTVVDKLKNDYQYTNMYKYKEYDARGKAKKKVGFITNGKTKPIMINDFVELFETNQICIKSKDLLSEMKLFAFKNGKMEAITGNHDDLVMSFAMALVGLKSGLNYV